MRRCEARSPAVEVAEPGQQTAVLQQVSSNDIPCLYSSIWSFYFRHQSEDQMCHLERGLADAGPRLNVSISCLLNRLAPVPPPFPSPRDHS